MNFNIFGESPVQKAWNKEDEIAETVVKPRLKAQNMTTTTQISSGGVAGEQLKSFIERIETLEEEKKGIAEDIKEVYAGAKAVGFDTKVMRKVIAIRKMDPADRQELEAVMDLYLHAIEGN